MPMDKDKKNKNKIKYSVLVQIQTLNRIFNQQQTQINKQQQKGSIFIVLLQRIPSNYEVVVSVSNSFDVSEVKELNIGMNNINPVCIIPWPLPKIGGAVSFLFALRIKTETETNKYHKIWHIHIVTKQR